MCAEVRDGPVRRSRRVHERGVSVTSPSLLQPDLLPRGGDRPPAPQGRRQPAAGARARGADRRGRGPRRLPLRAQRQAGRHAARRARAAGHAQGGGRPARPAARRGYGVFLDRHDDGTVDVFTGGRKLRVSVSPNVEVDEPAARPGGHAQRGDERRRGARLRARPATSSCSRSCSSRSTASPRALVIGHTDEERVVFLADSAAPDQPLRSRRLAAARDRGRATPTSGSRRPRSRSSSWKRSPTSTTPTSAACRGRSSRSATPSSCRSCTPTCSASTSCGRRRASCSTARPAAARR